VDVTQSVEEVEEKQSEEMTTGDVSEMKEEIVVKEEFEGPLPLIEVKPVPSTVITGDAVRLVCKVAEEPASEIFWSKNGRRLEVAPNNNRVNMGVDAKTGMHFLEIVEASLEDIGEYTITAENDGGVVACTVSVDVVSKVDESSIPKETDVPHVVVTEVGEQFRSLEQVAADTELCESTEPLGKVETGEMVIVEGSELQRATEAAPVFVLMPRAVCVDEGSAVRLQCQVEG